MYMSNIEKASRIASVGSPSSNYEVTLDLNGDGRKTPLVGTMLALTNPLGEGAELGIGTVTEVTTRNRWHEDSNFRGAAGADGSIEGFSGDYGDTRTAQIRLQAAWRKNGEDEEWRPSGPSLRMSPATGQPVRLIDDTIIAELTAGEKDLHYAGYLGGTENVPLPLSLPDFAGNAGAWHAGIYGQSGSGKTQMTSYLLANQMRHPNLGVIIVDPQGQWAAEEGMAFSVQGFAQELGREVKVRRISDHLQLSKDANLLTILLGKTRFLPEVTKMSEETQSLVLDEIAKVVKDTDDWTEISAAQLMRIIFTELIDPNQKYMSRIYADETRQERLRDAINDILESDKRTKEILRYFSPIHNLFQSTNPVGGTRHSLWHEISAVFDRAPNVPAPMLILDMSSKAPPGLDDADAMAAAVAYEVLENDSVKAAILRNLFSTLKRASEAQFRDGVNLNTLVVLDEAWRYAPNPKATEDKEIADLSRELAGYARDTRKFGIGWLYISQSTRSVNLAIWDQMSVRVFGFGLSGGDLDKISEIIDDRSSLRLYRAFGNPRSTGKFPFLLTGPVSPLSANATPIVVNAYTDFDEFRSNNNIWIKPIRDSLGKDLISGPPKLDDKVKSNSRKASKNVKNPTREIVETNKEIAKNRDLTSVKDENFGNPLDSLDSEAPF
jgi:hypothetical protein